MNRDENRLALGPGVVLLTVLCTAYAFANESIGDAAAADAENGKRQYNTTCVACHGEDGKGLLPGVPDFRGKDNPLTTKETATLLRNVADGYRSPGSALAMPPKGGNPRLSEQDILDILHYMRSAFDKGK